MVGGQTDVKLVSNAMANATRRKIMATLVEKDRTREEIEQACRRLHAGLSPANAAAGRLD